MKRTKKPSKKPMTKKAAPTKPGRTPAPKAAMAVSKPAPSKAAAKTAKPGEKTLLKKPAAAKKTSAIVKKTGAGEKPSDKTKKRVKISTVKKPAGTKTPALSQKSSQGKAEKIQAPSAVEPKATGEKLQEAALQEPAPKKIAAKVSAAPVKKGGKKVKGRSSKEIAADEKTARTVKKPSAAKVEKKPVKAKSFSLKTAEKGKQKTPAKAVSERVAPSKPSVKAVRKSAAPLKAGEKEQKPSPKEKAAPARVATKPAEEKKTITPKAPAREKKGPVVSSVAGAQGKTPVRKTAGEEKGQIITAKIPTKTVAALKKPAEEESGATLLSVKPEGAKLKIFLPGAEAGEEDIREDFIAGLPEEYGENALIAMAVDPNVIFVAWEVVPGEIAGKEGDLTLRFYDVTGTEFDGNSAHAILDTGIAQRVGSGFFVIRMPGRDVTVEAGIASPEGSFHTVMRSDIVSLPFLLTFDDLGIVQGLFASGIPVGY